MAYRNAARILKAVKASGLKYTLVPGWKSRGRGEMGSIQTITVHHTATPRSFKKSSDYPTMNVVKNGRPGLPGPLAQLGLGRSGRVYVIAAGRANHAGVSKRPGYTNSHAIGIEAEGAMEAWPAVQYQAYVRLCKALSEEFNAVVRGHKETAHPPGRKSDPSFDMGKFRKDISKTSLQKVKPSLQKVTPSLQKVTPSVKKVTEEELKRIGRGSRVADITIKPGEEKRIPMTDKGVYRVATVNKGQLVDGLVNIDIEGIPAQKSVSVNAVLAAWDKVRKRTTIKHRYPSIDIVGKDGGRVRSQYRVLDPWVGYAPSKGEEMTIQISVKNSSGAPIKVTYSSHEVLGS